MKTRICPKCNCYHQDEWEDYSENQFQISRKEIHTVSYPSICKKCIKGEIKALAIKAFDIVKEIKGMK